MKIHSIGESTGEEKSKASRVFRFSDIDSPADPRPSFNTQQSTMSDEENHLPSGWEQFEGKKTSMKRTKNRVFPRSDDQGVYFWHKRTGTVTRDRPELFLDSPSSTLSSSSSNDICFETNFVTLRERIEQFDQSKFVSLRFDSISMFSVRRVTKRRNNIVFTFDRSAGRWLTKRI